MNEEEIRAALGYALNDTTLHAGHFDNIMDIIRPLITERDSAIDDRDKAYDVMADLQAERGRAKAEVQTLNRALNEMDRERNELRNADARVRDVCRDPFGIHNNHTGTREYIVYVRDVLTALDGTEGPKPLTPHGVHYYDSMCRECARENGPNSDG